MKEPKTFMVDGDLYTVQPFLTSHGMHLLTEIFTLFGVSAVQMAFQVKDAPSVGEADVSADSVGAALAQLTGKLKPDVVDSLFKRILAGTLIGSTSVTAAQKYDTHFQARYGHLFKVVWKSLEAQYGDFLGALGGLAGLARRATSPE